MISVKQYYLWIIVFLWIYFVHKYTTATHIYRDIFLHVYELLPDGIQGIVDYGEY